MENKSFIVDTSKLKDIADILSDDCGVWLNYGTNKRHYHETSENNFEKINIEDGNCKQYYTLTSAYYRNKNSKDFRRKISFVTGNFYFIFILHKINLGIINKMLKLSNNKVLHINAGLH